MNFTGKDIYLNYPDKVPSLWVKRNMIRKTHKSLALDSWRCGVASASRTWVSVSKLSSNTPKLSWWLVAQLILHNTIQTVIKHEL